MDEKQLQIIQGHASDASLPPKCHHLLGTPPPEGQVSILALSYTFTYFSFLKWLQASLELRVGQAICKPGRDHPLLPRQPDRSMDEKQLQLMVSHTDDKSVLPIRHHLVGTQPPEGQVSMLALPDLLFLK